MITLDQWSKITTIQPAFLAMSEGLRDRFRREAVVQESAAGSTMFQEGGRCAGFPILLSGRVRVAQTGDTGRELLLYHLESGDMCVMSANCLFEDRPHDTFGVAETDVAVLVLPRELLDALMGELPDFRFQVLRLFTQRLREVSHLASSLALETVSRRLAVYLRTNGPIVHRSHAQIAEELGTVREIISRHLRRLADAGHLELGRSVIRVVHPDQLG